MRTSKIVATVAGALAALVACGLVLAGAGLLLLHATARDDSGYYNSPSGRYETAAPALTSQRIDLGTDVRGGWGPLDRLGTARIEVRPNSDRPVFVGIARAADVDRYLVGTAHDQITSVSSGPFTVRYRAVPGAATAAPPAAQTFWAASASGTGPQRVPWPVELRWPVEQGSWSVVVLNADGSPGVDVTARAGIATGVLLPIGLGVLGVGLVIGAAALALLLSGLRRPRATVPVQPGPDSLPRRSGRAEEPSVSYPLRLEGRLDEHLSRSLWLVKWLLALPHFVVLVFLWSAFGLLTLVAGIVVLFTGRYPRGIFDFNVGVMRWTWRVTFYALLLGTDRYPPFALREDSAYPADLFVSYPGELSRPLVLVKWWLLALPHIVIVSIFGGGLAWWTYGGDRSYSGPGLIAVLCLIAGVMLAVTGTYPKTIFDLVMGLERWTYRVLAYTALMRDEYPPFRLDQGGRELRDGTSASEPSGERTSQPVPTAMDAPRPAVPRE